MNFCRDPESVVSSVGPAYVPTNGIAYRPYGIAYRRVSCILFTHGLFKTCLRSPLRGWAGSDDSSRQD